MHNTVMSTPVGPSLQLALGLSECMAEVTIMAAQAAWNRWFGSQRFYRKLAQFESNGWIERVPARDGAIDGALILTAAGRLAAMGGRDPETCWSRGWDGRWRIVLFDIPEAQRTIRMRLCRGLRQLGFGYLQNSVWVSPDSTAHIAGLLKGAKLDVETLSIMEANPVCGQSDADVVQGAWDFRRINRNYELYLEVLQSKPAIQKGRIWQTWLAVEWKAWNRAIVDDPMLPAALNPTGYQGREAWKRRTAAMRRLFGQGVSRTRATAKPA